MVFMFMPLYSHATTLGYSTPQSESFVEFIGAFLERRTQALIETPAQEALPIKIALGNSNSENDEAIFEPDTVLSYERKVISEINDRREVLREWGEGYTHFEQDVVLTDSDIRDSTAVFVVQERTRLYYERIHGEEPEFMSWTSERQFVFELGQQGWALVDHQLLNAYGPAPMNEAANVTRDEMTAALARMPLVSPEDHINDRNLRESDRNHAENSVISRRATFNRQAAADYALTWAEARNPAYRSFSANCTNFVSQAMRAGGWTDISGLYTNAQYWWYNSLNQTYSWTSVSYWYSFAYTYSGRTTILGQPRSLYVGEVLQADFESDGTKDHSMMVTYRTTSPTVEIYLSYNTTDTTNRSFASLLTALPSATWTPHLVFTSF